MKTDIIEKARKILSKRDLSDLPYKFAVQINLTGKATGVFYVEVLDGKLSVEPYEYNDKDASVSLNKTTFDNIISGKLNIDEALHTKKLIIDGDAEALLQFKKLF
jgi:putative sterol carrier protein